MPAQYMNRVCGSVFIDSPIWSSFDCMTAERVQKDNLLGRFARKTS